MAKKSAKAQRDEPEEEAQDTEEPNAGGKAISKTEAIRRAVAAGMETPEDGIDFILKNFGLDLSRQHFSATRSKLRSKEAEGKPAKGKPGRKPKAAPSQAVEGYLAPPPKPHAAGEQPDLLAAIEAMKPLVEALGKAQAHRIVDLLG